MLFISEETGFTYRRLCVAHTTDDCISDMTFWLKRLFYRHQTGSCQDFR